MSDGRPLRFLLLTLGGWTAFRVVALWPAADPVPMRTAVAVPRLHGVPAHEQVQGSVLRVYANDMTRTPNHPVSVSRPQNMPLPEQSIPRMPAIASARPEPSRVPTIPPPFVPPALASASPAPPPSRWAASVYALVRRGGRAPLLGGQLGGSQAGARVTYLLDPRHRLAVAARVAAALETRGKEAAVGLDWQPPALPLHVVAEQRFGLDGYRGGPALSVVGGIGPVELAPRVAVEGYGQAGGIARATVEGFADGSMRVAYRAIGADRRRLDLGLGAWGGAQRGASRLDVGPTIGVVVPVGDTAIRMTLDWRQRVAGHAAPGSGLALSVGSDF